MSDIRFNRWLHGTGSGGVSQDSSGNIGIGSSVPRTALDVVGIVSATSFTGSLTGNVTGNVNATGLVVSGVSTVTDLRVGTAVTANSNGIQVGAGKSVRIFGSTSGFSDIIASSAAGASELLLPNTSGTLDRLNRAGNVLQVMQGSTSTTTTIASTTFADTSLSASITPSSSSSKILVFVDQIFNLYRLNTDQYGGIRLLRGSTVLHSPPVDGIGPYDTGLGITGTTFVNFYARQSIIYLDSPNTTSATTYKTQGAVYRTTNSGLANFQPAGSPTNSTSYITLVEVAA